MKILFLAFILWSNYSYAQSKLCTVYGISDSPQHMHCAFGSQRAELYCLEGQYFLRINNQLNYRVENAFHMEVERGNIPLVFQSAEVTLEMVKMARKYKAQLIFGNRTWRGKCRE
jgi:hypothetical protein